MQQPSSNNTVKKKVPWWVWLIGVFFLLAIIGNLCGENDTKKAAEKKSTISESTATQLPDEKEFYSVGEPIVLGDHTIIINKCIQGYTSSNEFDKPQSSKNEFVVVNVTTKNTSDNQISVNEFGFELEDDAGVKRTSTMIAGLDNTMETVELQPDGSITGNIPFEARSGSKSLVLHYSGNISSGGAKIRLK